MISCPGMDNDLVAAWEQVAGALAGFGVIRQCQTAAANEIAVRLGLTLTANDAKKLADAIGKGGKAGMAVALAITQAIAEAEADEWPAPIDLSPADQSIVATALENLPARSSPELARLRDSLRVLASQEQR